MKIQKAIEIATEFHEREYRSFLQEENIPECDASTSKYHSAQKFPRKEVCDEDERYDPEGSVWIVRFEVVPPEDTVTSAGLIRICVDDATGDVDNA